MQPQEKVASHLCDLRSGHDLFTLGEGFLSCIVRLQLSIQMM